MIIWSGLGCLVPIIMIVCLLVVAGLTAFISDDYYTTHGWPKLVALWATAVLLWPIGRVLNGGQSRELVDPDTGDTVTVQEGGWHTLFFIPIEYWSFVFIILGIVFLFV